MRKILLVVEETDHQGGFNFYLDGDKERLGKTPVDELSGAEAWGERLFMVCLEELRDAGVIQSEVKQLKKEDIH